MKNYLTIMIAFLTLSAPAQTTAKLDSLTKLLEKVYDQDQKPREEWFNIKKKYGSNSKEYSMQEAVVARLDSINQTIVLPIIDQYGWLSAEETSEKANKLLFLVIQHAPLGVQVKYLPVLEKAIQEGKAVKSTYPYLKDRINMYMGKYQIYGTQGGSDINNVLCFWPIADEPNVNARRKEFGMESIEEYSKDLNIKNYKAPAIDSLAGKVIITLFAFDKDERNIAAVQIFSGDHQLLGETNVNGAVRIIADKSVVDSHLILEKKGFSQTICNFEDKQKEVMYCFVKMKE